MATSSASKHLVFNVTEFKGWLTDVQSKLASYLMANRIAHGNMKNETSLSSVSVHYVPNAVRMSQSNMKKKVSCPSSDHTILCQDLDFLLNEGSAISQTRMLCILTVYIGRIFCCR